MWADGTQGSGDPSVFDVMSRITSDFNERQLSAIRQVSSPNDINIHCPQNFLLSSDCFAAIKFESSPTNDSTLDTFRYTILGDGSLTHIDTLQHASDYEKRILPLQWAVDSVSK